MKHSSLSYFWHAIKHLQYSKPILENDWCLWKILSLECSFIIYMGIFHNIYGENIFIWASMYTFIGNYSILDYFNILIILKLNSEFRDFKSWDQKQLLKGFVLEVLLEYFWGTVTTKLKKYCLSLFFCFVLFLLLLLLLINIVNNFKAFCWFHVHSFWVNHTLQHLYRANALRKHAYTNI